MNAKALLKVNYWKAVVASLVLAFCTNGMAVSSYNSVSDNTDGQAMLDEIGTVDPEVLLAGILLILAVVAIGWLIAALLSLFIGHPLEIGAQKLLVNCRYGRAEFGNIVYFFRDSYLNTVKTLFLRWLYITLWSLLFVIPGIIKSYSYRMVPYLIAENPHMSSQEAFDLSKKMMDGNKWNAFVLDLSFLGWHILGALTIGIVEIFYAAPYHNLANAELYHQLKQSY